MFLDHKKQFWRKILFLLLGVSIGFLALSQYKSQRDVRRLTSRDAAVSLVNQLQLAVTSNRELHEEIQQLKLKLTELRGGVNTRKEVAESMDSYRLLSGLDTVMGEGMELTVDLFLEPYWLIDFVNELYIAGAERVAINEQLITDLSGFTSQEDVIYLNGTSILSTPFTFQVIGNYEQILKSLRKPGGILARLESQFPGFRIEENVRKNKKIVIPSINPGR